VITTPSELAEASDGLEAGDLVEAVRVMLRRRRRGRGGPLERVVVLAMMAALDLPLSAELERRAEGLEAVIRGVRVRSVSEDVAPVLRELALTIEGSRSLPLPVRALVIGDVLSEVGASAEPGQVKSILSDGALSHGGRVAALARAARLITGGHRRARDQVRRALAR